jgi:endogenous inhibitor of DNA gyrase (YacG/DUF329 family)
LFSPVSFRDNTVYSEDMKKLEINCPRCGKKTFWENNPSRPFCSEKCRLIDLGCWANEDYTFAGGKAPRHEQDESIF